MFKLIIAICVFFAYVEAERYAKCEFQQRMHSHGMICMKENEDGRLVGHIDFHHEGSLKRFPVHVHTRAPTNGRCSTIGPHYNFPDPANEDEGDLGVLTLNDEGAVSPSKLRFHPSLSLSGANSVMGRSMAIHINKKKICCTIVECSGAEFQAMMMN